MPNQIRGSITAEAQAILTAACKEAGWSIGDVLSTALIHMRDHQDLGAKMEALLMQQRYILQTFQHIIEQNGWPAPPEVAQTASREDAPRAPHETPQQALPVDPSKYWEEVEARRNHHATHTHLLEDETEAEVAPGFKPRGRLTRLFVKERTVQ